MIYDIIFRKNTTYSRKQSEEVVDTVTAETRADALAMWFSGVGAAYTQQYLFASEDGKTQTRQSGSVAWEEGDETIDLGDEEVYVLEHKSKYAIFDRTATRGRNYIGHGNENTTQEENAISFDTKEEAQQYIETILIPLSADANYGKYYSEATGLSDIFSVVEI